MSTRMLLAILAFGGDAVLLIILLDRLLMLRGSKDETDGSQDRWADPDIGIGD
jgi:hypothetical protein